MSIVPAMKIMLVFSLLASLGKYTFRIENLYLLIDCSMLEKWRIVKPASVHKSSHLSKQVTVNNSFIVTGWIGKALIRYRRCLLLETKGIKQCL